MSYDLDLYVAKAPALSPPSAGRNGQFAVDPPARIEKEDIPEDYRSLIGKRRRVLIRIHIEGAPEPSAVDLFETWLADVIAETNGILIDEQAGQYQTPKKSASLPSAATPEEANLGEMSFFF